MEKRKDGVIYTPAPVVERMLDMVGYLPWKISMMKMDIMDNSCGTGHILVAAADRLCKGLENASIGLNLTPDDKYTYFKKRLLERIHGMEVNPVSCDECRKNLNTLAESYLCQPVDWDWDIKCCDSLNEKDGRQFDFVVCNPPYIRVHDLESDLSGYRFVEKGMKDIYLAFYELGLRQTSPDGSLCYIAPSSWFTSEAGKSLREHVLQNRLIDKVYDYGHEQVFDGVTTYTAIVVMTPLNARISPEYIDYESHDTGKRLLIPYSSVSIDGKIYFTDPGTFREMERIMKCEKGKIKVKNGYATNADDIFIIGDTPWPTGGIVIPAVKSSTGNISACIYPYGRDGKLLPEETLKEISPVEYKWLSAHRETLESRKTDEPWYAFGRTQAIGDTYKDKWAIKSIIKSLDDVKPVKASAGVGVYGGLYILCEDKTQLECLHTEDFFNYVKALKKYKSGGYYTFSSKDLENFLNYHNYGEKERENNGV